MKIIPQQYFLLVRMHDIPTDSRVELPDGLAREPYGEVIATGPQCTFVRTGDLVLFNLEMRPIGFDKGGDERYIIPESSVFAKCDPDSSQSGHPELKILKTPEHE